MYHGTCINKIQSDNEIICNAIFNREDSMKNHVTFPFKKDGRQFDFLTTPGFSLIDNNLQLVSGTNQVR